MNRERRRRHECGEEPRDSAATYYAGPAKRHRCRLAKFQNAEGHRCLPALVMDNAVHNQIKRGNTVPSENQNIPHCKF